MKPLSVLPPKTTATSVSNMICQALREHILSGEYGAGTQLRQSDIASQFGVSHIPVREALQTLKHEGLVDQIANHGAFVASISLTDLKNICSLRRSLEPLAVEQAIERVEDLDLERAAKIIKAASQETDDLVLVRLNWEFHLSLYKPCGNDLLIEVIQNLYRKADRYSCVLWINHDYRVRAEQEHTEILECYRRSDVDRAVGCTLQHIDEVERLVRQTFGRDQEGLCESAQEGG